MSSPIRLPTTSLNCIRRMSSELKLNRNRAIGDHNRLECFVFFCFRDDVIVLNEDMIVACDQSTIENCVADVVKKKKKKNGQTPSDIRGESSQV